MLVSPVCAACDKKPANNFLVQWSRLNLDLNSKSPVDLCKFHPDTDFADVTLGQWNLSRTVSALRDYSQGSGLVQDQPGPCAPLSGPGLQFPSLRCCPPRPLCAPPPGLLRHLRRSSSTACTALWVEVVGWDRGLPGSVTRGTRRS